MDTDLGVLPSARRRRAWARSVDHLLEAVNRKHAAPLFPHPDWDAPLLLRTEVVLACQAELMAIRDALLDQRRPISAQALQELKGFLTGSSTSPLFGTNAALARRDALQLRDDLTGQPPP
ncbi:MAG TPA: hypothetical protein VJ735_04015 [Actinomycetes bacterium]|nr:hypothetical protein [Actinomycetes bacterium]